MILFYFQLFAYFKNVSLLSCFLGLGIGFTMADKKYLTTLMFFPLLSLQIIPMHLIRQLVPELTPYLQNPVSEQLAFGLSSPGKLLHLLTAYGFLVLVFAFNAICFIPLGQIISRLMMKKNELISYSWNLAGSILGIVIFYFLSFLCTPPSVWILFGILMFIPLIYKNTFTLIISSSSALIMVAITGITFQINQFDIYSPYQYLSLCVTKKPPLILCANNTYHQRLIDIKKTDLIQYDLPYLFKNDTEQILIVGSGTGNDVASALKHMAGEIDAVEIDPVILNFGKMLHPDSPYQSGRVKVITGDARYYIKNTDKKYDLIVYGLLDSHTLLSGMSAVRLDSYVYTVEAFREARSRLKNGGIISLSFAVLTPEIGRKLYIMLEEAFDGQKPLVYQTGYDASCLFLTGEGIEEYKKTFVKPSALNDVTEFFSDSKIMADKSTDDWPFLYMPVRKYPFSYVIMVILLLIISVIFIFQYCPDINHGFSGSCFFLGAGFMLVETKGITELALVYGSNWLVIGIVILFIIIMAFLANLLVIKKITPPVPVTYSLLFISLIAGLTIHSLNLITSVPWLNTILVTVILTIPLFFSGFAFSFELKKSSSVPVSLSSNLLGAMLGGFLEYNSMYFGFHALYFLALAMYGLAFICSMRDLKKT